MRKLLLLLPAWTPSWVILPALDRDYRRLVLWSYRLVVKVQMMSWIVSLAGPFATPGVAAFLNRQADALSAEMAKFRRALRERRQAGAVRAATIRTEQASNPWR